MVEPGSGAPIIRTSFPTVVENDHAGGGKADKREDS